MVAPPKLVSGWFLLTSTLHASCSPTMNVSDYLLEGKASSAPALLTLHGQHTYAELRLAVERVAWFVRSRGAERGDRAILLADNSFFWVATYLGVIRAGMVCVPLSPKSSLNDLASILDQTQPALIFVESWLAPAIHELRPRIMIITNGPARAGGNLQSTSFSDIQAAEHSVCAGLIAKFESGRPTSVKDDMALVGILSTELLLHQFIHHKRGCSPWKPPLQQKSTVSS